MRLQIAFLFPKLTKEQQEMLMEKKLKQMEQQPPPNKSAFMVVPTEFSESGGAQCPGIFES